MTLPLYVGAIEHSNIQKPILSQQFVWNSDTGYYNIDHSSPQVSEYEAPHKKAKGRTRIWTKMFPFVVEHVGIQLTQKTISIERKISPYSSVLLISHNFTSSLRGPPQLHS